MALCMGKNVIDGARGRLCGAVLCANMVDLAESYLWPIR